jgi:peptidyl-prolyl cis-trans isomerase A (cyclophilin A)
VDNSQSLDPQGFSPFGRVVSGMEAVDKINTQYGQQPDQSLIQSQGNRYLDKEFPKLDRINKATIVK